MTLQEFKTKFSPFIPTANFSSPSLDENAFVQKFCKEMIADAFPLLVPFQDQLLKNYMYSEYKSVIANIYDGLCFALETGWFEIGLDKCSRPTTNPNNVEFSAVQTTGTHIYNVRVITNSAVQPTHILADSESSYRKLLIKGIHNFIAFLQENPYDTEYAYVSDFIGMKLDFDDVQYLVDGFCGINKEIPLQIVGQLPSTIPNDDYYHYGNFSYVEKNNTCVSDTNGLPLRVKRSLIDKAKENSQGWRVEIGSKPYATSYSDFDCSVNFGFYEDKMFSGTSTDLDDWAAML
jgi:hypothetical protein